MKNPLLILAAMCLAFPALAQQPSLANRTHTKTYQHPSASRQGPVQASPASTTIFSENFATGLPATWTVTDNAGNGEVWTYTNAGPANGIPLSTTGTTAANGYMMFDSDGGGVGSGAEDSDLETPAINCVGNTQVFLSFNELYTEYQLDSSFVSVSNNGITWTTFYCPDILLSENASTTNPNLVTLDISAVAANMPTVYVRFHYSGDWDYWWMIDDVRLFVPSAVDAQAVSSTPISAEYTRLPLSQAVNMQLSGEVKNVGGTTLTGAVATFQVIDTVSNTVVFTTAGIVPPLTPLASAMVVSSTNYTAGGTGYFRTRITVNATGDADTTNNKASSFQVVNINDSVYARDNNVVAGELGIGAGPQQGIIGQNFNLTHTDVITSVSFFLTDAMNPNPSGSPVYVTIHPQTANTAPGASIASTTTMTITTGSIPAGGAWYTLPMSNGPVWLNPGLYYVGVHEVDSLLPLAISDAIVTPMTVWVSWATIPTPPAVNGWANADDFGFFLSYLLRPNFGPVLNTVGENNAPAFSLYPNPSADQVTLSFADNNDRDIEVYTAAGALVMTSRSTGTTATLDFSAVAEGIYFVKVKDGTQTGIQKVTIVR